MGWSQQARLTSMGHSTCVSNLIIISYLSNISYKVKKARQWPLKLSSVSTSLFFLLVLFSKVLIHACMYVHVCA